VKELNDYKYALDESAIVAITDQKGTIIHANDNFCKISKYSREELIGKDHRIINSGYHSKEFIRDLWVTIANGKIWRGELKNRAKDGTVYWVDTTIVPFLNEENKPFRYVAIRADITQRKQVEEELLKYSAALEHQNTQLVDFCNIVSHNLRGPILNISMLVDYIEKSSNLEKQLEAMSKIKPVINHLMEVFNELVESIQVKQDTAVKSEYNDFEECCEKVLIGFEVQIKEYQAQISMDFSKAKGIHFPHKYLDSVFTNLISNALKYRSPDRAPVIKIKTSKSVDGVLLTISDNGLGIDLNLHQDKIFKIRKVFHNHPDAKGFGLFMLKTQVEAMGGTVWVESKPDEGSTFFIKLKNQMP
jgi:PAS domain S-box-containing protein